MKIHKIKNIMAAVGVGLFLMTLTSSCTWVKKTPEAEKVRIVPADLVTKCKNIGSVTTSTVSNISVVNRSSNKVKSELETLAQIEAAKSSADTIVASSEIVDGRQTFEMYQCLQ